MSKPYKPKPKRVGSFSRFNFSFPFSFSLSHRKNISRQNFTDFSLRFHSNPLFFLRSSFYSLLSAIFFNLSLYSQISIMLRKKILNILNLLVRIFFKFFVQNFIVCHVILISPTFFLASADFVFRYGD